MMVKLVESMGKKHFEYLKTYATPTLLTEMT